MRDQVVGKIKQLLGRYGYALTRIDYGDDVEEASQEYPIDFDEATIDLVKAVQGETMTPPERLHSLRAAIHYVVNNQIDGAFVECGVWRGGSMKAAALTLHELKNQDRELYLFDTFEGMPKPTKEDVDWQGLSMLDRWNAEHRNRFNRDARASLKDVQAVMGSSGYDMSKVHMVKGMVEDTIPDHAPESIAILRLDTDYYASTLHELEHLYPRLVSGGVLVIDDYGHFKGAEQAVTEYFESIDQHVLLHRVDYASRVIIKP